MAKKSKQASCVRCGTIDGLYIFFANGEKLPSYRLMIGEGVVCNECADQKVGASE
jgi:hypothetical protein